MVSRLPAALSFDQTRADPRPSVAVMPFATMSGDQSYFADGLTEDVTTALARNSELQIVARDSTYAVRGQESDVRKLGVKLGVSYVVEGSALRQAGCRRLYRSKRADHGNRRPACAVYRPK